MLSCYFIARAGSGVEGLSLDFVRHADLVAAVRRRPPALRPTPDQMLAYQAALSAASKVATILPLRFGTSFRSEAAVRQLLAARAGELASALERLEGKVEMTLRLRVEAGESPAEQVRELNAAGRPLEAWSEVRTDRAGGTVVELAHLIAKAEEREYRRRVEREEVEVTGPWPPLHFLPQFLRMPVRAESRRSVRARRTG
jgi:hypothetical protein